MLSPAIQCICFLGLALAAVSMSAQTAASEAKPPLPPQVKAAVAVSLPKFELKLPPPALTVPPPFPANAEPTASDVLALPKVVVKEKRKLTTSDVLTLEGKVDRLMDDYLGSKHSFDRGFLNKGVMNWRIGPGNVSLFGAETNETRALEARFDDNRLRHRKDLLETATLLDLADDPAKALWLRRQSTDLFYRKPDIRRRR